MLRRRTRHRHPHRAGLTVLLVAVAASGCGGGEDDPEYPAGVSQPQSKVEFLREADRICFSSESRIEAAADELLAAPGRPDPDEVERVALGIAVPALEAEVRAIRSLGAPAGDEREVEAILAATERGIAEIEADPRSLAERRPPGLRQAQRLAERYGARQCGF